MIMKNPGQVLLTKEEAVTLRMFLKELCCPDSKVSCDICPFFLKQTNVCIAGYLRGLALTGHIVERKKRDKSTDPDIFDYLKAIPDIKKRGVPVLSKCPCGGTLTSIRSEYNGHLHVMCDKCKFVLHE